MTDTRAQEIAELPILMSDSRPLKHPVKKKRTSSMRIARRRILQETRHD